MASARIANTTAHVGEHATISSGRSVADHTTYCCVSPKIRCRPKFVAAAVLIACTLLTYAGLYRNDFVNFDDPDYLTSNRWVQQGLSWDSFTWALTTDHASNWHPLTWLSHILDWELFGEGPAAHHAVNLAWHVGAGLLLFWFLTEATGQMLPSALVVAIFLLHPLQVESVAWSAQRKSVLSGFFWMATLVLYLRYRRQPSLGRYLLVTAAVALALLAKPLAVTLPLVLLLLDYWPLGSDRSPGNERGLEVRRKLLEKLPLLALAFAVAAVTYFVQDAAKSDVAVLPLAQRCSNAIVSYLTYLESFVWPGKLAVLYPHPRETLSLGRIIAAAAVCSFITGVTVWARVTRPYLLVGWLWYVVTLVPMIGLVQVGRQSHADRYAYIPIIGLAILFLFGLWDIAKRFPLFRNLLAAAIGLWLLWLSTRTFEQVGYWRNSETLFRHTIAVTQKNSLAHYMLGLELGQQGKRREAISEMRTALEIEPSEHSAHLAIASFLVQQGDYGAALNELKLAIRSNPEVADSFYRRGELLILLGQPAEALTDFQKAISLDPDNVALKVAAAEAKLRLGQSEDARVELEAIVQKFPENVAARNALGVIAAQQGDPEAAQRQFEAALALDQSALDPRRNLALLLIKTSRLAEAEALLTDGFQRHSESAARRQLLGILISEGQLQAATRLLRLTLSREPENWELANDLAWILATSRGMSAAERQEGLTWAEKAVVGSDGHNAYRDTLAAAQAATGDFAAAIKTAEEVIANAEREGNLSLAASARQRLQLYQQGKPYVAESSPQ